MFLPWEEQGWISLISPSPGINYRGNENSLLRSYEEEREREREGKILSVNISCLIAENYDFLILIYLVRKDLTLIKRAINSGWHLELPVCARVATPIAYAVWCPTFSIVFLSCIFLFAKQAEKGFKGNRKSLCNCTAVSSGWIFTKKFILPIEIYNIHEDVSIWGWRKRWNERGRVHLCDEIL